MSNRRRPADDTGQAMISIPAADITQSQFKNLIFMLYGKQNLINRMTNSNCLCIPDCVIDELNRNNDGGPGDFTQIFDDSKAAGFKGIDYRDGKFSMAFPMDEVRPERWTVYAKLMNRIYDVAIKATRVSPNLIEPDEQNEKFLAHSWLQRLGYRGPDFKTDRSILLGHLKGCCAFSCTEKLKAHGQKYTEKRRAEREAKREAESNSKTITTANAAADLEAGDAE